MTKQTRLFLLVVAALAAIVALQATPAFAGPVWRITAQTNTTVAPGATTNYRVELSDFGDAPLEASSEPFTFTASFPGGLKATAVEPLETPDFGVPITWDCVKNPFPASTVKCTESGGVLSVSNGGNASFVMLQVAVTANGDLPPGAVKTASFEIAGGGAAPARAVVPITIGSPPAFGLAALDSLTAADPAGTPSTQAGAHPYDSSVSFDLNTVPNPSPFAGDAWPVAPIKDIYAELPAGFVGNPTVATQCTADQLANSRSIEDLPLCSPSSQVGTATIRDDSGLVFPNSYSRVAVYNMVPPTGIPARFGFNVLGTPVLLDAKLRSDGDYGFTIVDHNVPEGLPLAGSTVTLWGDPASPVHDQERACPGEGPAFPAKPHCSSGVAQKPFLRNPTSCGGSEALATSMSVDSWFDPGRLNESGLPDLSDPAWSSMSMVAHEAPGYPLPPADWGPPVQMEGCEKVPVKGSLTAQTTALEAQTPSGLQVSLEVPNAGMENPSGIATSDLKAAKVTLPEGMTINPSQAEGLGVCSSAQYATEEASFHPVVGHGCPSDSQIGTVEVHTQLLSEVVDGDVYIAAPYDNPFDSLIAIYIVLKDPERGILVKIPGKVAPDPVTGQIVATFEGLPQLPFEKFTFRFKEGARAPLVTPSACGTYQTEALLTAWSDPAKPIVSTSTFQIVDGIGGGPCPSGGVPPFDPSVISGSINADAGSYTPFYLRIARQDGEQELTGFSTVLPPGLTGNLTGIPFCPDASIEAARTRTGQEELASPSCPAASQIGHTLVGAGVGGTLAWTPGKVYLAGPYHGSSLSIVSITSATVGPFDLGTVVIRFALKINPVTAQVEIDSAGSDPIPHIIDGIVVHVRDIHVYIDRERFIRNPTNCNTMSIANALAGAGANIADPNGQDTVEHTTRFQVADCTSLGFKPAFKASTSGKTSRANGASLTVKLTYPKAPEGSQANIHAVKVSLPKQLPSRLTTLQKACLDSTFDQNPAACPAASRVGTAKAITPILPEPLAGPAYFVSHGSAKFPELVIVLQGYGITIDLHGETFISAKGITSSTFSAVPDEPVTSFTLTLPQGPNSALAANGNLCAAKLKMPTIITAQNGQIIKQSTPIAVSGCPKRRPRRGGGPA